MYSWSSYLSQISLKNFFGKVVFQILAQIEMTRNENRLFGRHFETVQIFYIFFPEIWLWLVYTYGVKIIKKIRCESAGYFMQLSVNT